MKLLDAAVLLQPDFADAWNRRAFLYFLKERLAEAGAAIDHALRIQPDSNQSYMIQSLILSASGKTKEAMSAIDRSLAISCRSSRCRSRAR